MAPRAVHVGYKLSLDPRGSSNGRTPGLWTVVMRSESLPPSPTLNLSTPGLTRGTRDVVQWGHRGRASRTVRGTG